MLAAAFLILALSLGVTTTAKETPTPAAQGYRGADHGAPYAGQFLDLAQDIDHFWAETFHAARVPYVSPEIVSIDQRLQTACGPASPYDYPFYCPRDSTIYLGPVFLAAKQAAIGDYAPITVLAHEWGHHVQLLTQAPNEQTKIFELRADCLAGVYTRDAEHRGLLDPGDLSEAVILAKDVGDPLGLPQDDPDAHGINDERIKAFMLGYLDGLVACSLSVLDAGIPQTPAAPVTPQEAPALPLADILPNTLPLSHANCFRIEDDGILDLDALAGRLGGTEESRTKLQQWGWRTSAYRIFACDTPPEGDAGWIEVGVHRFADAVSAQQALDYFATQRAAGTSLVSGSAPPIGDRATVLSGPATNGSEITLYVSDGPWLVRVTGISRSGIPFSNVLAVALGILKTPLPASPTTPLPDPLKGLPSSLPLRDAACFRVLTEGTYPFADARDWFVQAGATSQQFESWGWQSGAYRVFGCDTAPPGGVSQVDVVVHVFGSADDASKTVSFAERGYTPSPSEARRCESAGPKLACVTGRSSAGPPDAEVDSVLQFVLGNVLGAPATATAPPTPPQPAPTGNSLIVYLPDALTLVHSSCFRADDPVTYDFPSLVARFPGVPNAAKTLQTLGWQDGAYRQFSCDDPPAGSVGWIDMSVHRFMDAASAAAAGPFFASARAFGTQLETVAAPTVGDSATALAGPSDIGTEYTLYVSAGPLLLRVTGVAPVGDPELDVEHVMLALYADVQARGRDGPVGEPTVITSATALPTATPSPTSAPTPTPTATATPLPTQAPSPTPISNPGTLPTTAPVSTMPPQTAAPAPTTAATAAVTPRPAPTQVVVQRCDFVELYPGYPGYRGYVAGVDGPAEVACLSDLIAATPGFDRAAEDSANLAAARAIGLAGSPRDWTWENWMAIEAERGLVPTCYSCLFRDLGPSPARESAEWEPTDPRLRMGGYGTSDALIQAAADAGMGLNSTAFIEYKFDPNDQDALGADHVLRAFIGLTWPGHHTAPEMIDAYGVLFTVLSGAGTTSFDLGLMWDTVLAHGGYAPTPPNAHFEDQMYMVRAGAEAMCFQMSEDVCRGWLLQYDGIEALFVSEVRAQSGPDVVYIDWLREKFGDLF